MAGLRSVLDANILIPAAPRDTLLRAAEEFLYLPVWSAIILDEVERNLVELGMSDARGAAHLIQTMREVFPDALVSGFEHLIPALTNHPGDRHVLAAAMHAGADVIVTQNRRHFARDAVRPSRIEVTSLDEFLVELYLDDADKLQRIVRQQAADLANPPCTFDEVVDTLAVHTPEFSRLIRSGA